MNWPSTPLQDDLLAGSDLDQRPPLRLPHVCRLNVEHVDERRAPVERHRDPFGEPGDHRHSGPAGQRIEGVTHRGARAYLAQHAPQPGRQLAAARGDHSLERRDRALATGPSPACTDSASRSAMVGNSVSIRCSRLRSADDSAESLASTPSKKAVAQAGSTGSGATAARSEATSAKPAAAAKPSRPHCTCCTRNCSTLSWEPRRWSRRRTLGAPPSTRSTAAASRRIDGPNTAQPTAVGATPDTRLRGEPRRAGQIHQVGSDAVGKRGSP